MFHAPPPSSLRLRARSIVSFKIIVTCFIPVFVPYTEFRRVIRLADEMARHAAASYDNMILDMQVAHAAEIIQSLSLAH